AIADRQNVQNIGRPDDLRYRSWRPHGRGLRLGRRAWQDSERTAYGSVHVDPRTAALHDRNDQNAECNPEQQDADHDDAGPNPPGLIENMGIGNARIGHGTGPIARDVRWPRARVRSRTGRSASREPPASTPARAS